MKKVQLKVATKLKQAVAGSNVSSVYHTVALAPEFNAAARIVWSKEDLTLRRLSFRVEVKEGQLFTEEQALALLQMGLKRVSGEHFSVHANGNLVWVKMYLGGILMVLSQWTDKMTTDVEFLLSEGGCSE